MALGYYTDRVQYMSALVEYPRTVSRPPSVLPTVGINACLILCLFTTVQRRNLNSQEIVSAATCMRSIHYKRHCATGKAVTPPLSAAGARLRVSEAHFIAMKLLFHPLEFFCKYIGRLRPKRL